MSDDVWPAPVGNDATESDKKIFDAQLAAAKKKLEVDEDMRKARSDHIATARTEFVKSVVEVARSGIDRSRTAAQLVQTAASAIAGLLATALGVAFSVAEKPLPSRGLAPGVLLGLAIVLSTVYVAYVTPPEAMLGPQGSELPATTQLNRARFFVEWTNSITMRRAYWLRASVLALGAALAFLPAPFISASTFQPSTNTDAKADTDKAVKTGRATATPSPSNTKEAGASTRAVASPAPTLAPWPSLPSEEADVRLTTHLYKAQVAEVREVRRTQLEGISAGDPATAARSERDLDRRVLQWLLGAIAGVFVLPLLLTPRVLGALRTQRSGESGSATTH